MSNCLPVIPIQALLYNNNISIPLGNKRAECPVELPVDYNRYVSVIHLVMELCVNQQV